MIPFNKPYLSGNETKYIEEAVASGKISGNGNFTQKCQLYFENKLGSYKTLLTTSCTDALEMCAILLNVKEGDEIIMPSYTFVSTANAFVLRGAKIIFVDSRKDNPNIDEAKIEALITKKSKAIVVVHYAGVACEMDAVMSIAKKHNLFVVEDAAQAIDSYYKGKPLGSIGHLAAFSFHETKNIQCGEGGLLAINDEQFIQRAEIIWEKGTNRSAFFRGEINKYGWVDIGSSFLPSELNAAFLWAQLENLDNIQERRKEIWNSYYFGLKEMSKKNNVKLQLIPKNTTNNDHMFYLLCNSYKERASLIKYLRSNNIYAVFHYLSLHKSEFYTNYSKKKSNKNLLNSDRYENTLLRLPLFYQLSLDNVNFIINKINNFYNNKNG
jgi:dTDP-4-amino-4,6-dideoxygalactose transaminase